MSLTSHISFSSIIPAASDSTLRRNFQQIQEGRTLTPNETKPNPSNQQNNQQHSSPTAPLISEPLSPPKSVSVPPQRLIGNIIIWKFNKRNGSFFDNMLFQLCLILRIWLQTSRYHLCQERNVLKESRRPHLLIINNSKIGIYLNLPINPRLLSWCLSRHFAE